MEQTSEFANLVRDADLSVPVPTCPEWNLGQLVRHLGRGTYWAAQIVHDELHEALDPRDVRGGKSPADSAGMVAWLNDGAQALLDAVATTGRDTSVWTFLGPRPAQWWIRRRLHEVAVHRADAAIALDQPFVLDPVLAADAITEWIELFAVLAGRTGSGLPLAEGQVLHLHATDALLDGAGEWTITGRGTGIAWSHEHGPGDAVLRGGATELLLAVSARMPVSQTGIELCGDDALWRMWLDRTAL